MPDLLGGDDGLIARVEELRRRAADLGRGPIPVTLYGAPQDPARIEQLAAAGITRFVFWLSSATPGQVERELDELTARLPDLASSGCN